MIINKVTFLLVPAILTSTAALIMGATSIATLQSSSQPATNTQKPATLKINQPAPDFTLPDLQGTSHTLSDYTADNKIVVIEWFNPTCPFVRKNYRTSPNSILRTLDDLDSSKIIWLRINSALGSHLTAGRDLNKQTAKELGITGPILMDTIGSTGKAYFATKTPEIFIIDQNGNLAYHGAPDNRSDAAASGKTNHIKNALNQLLSNEPVSTTKTNTYGCRIKYD